METNVSMLFTGFGNICQEGVAKERGPVGLCDIFGHQTLGSGVSVGLRKTNSEHACSTASIL